MRRKIYDRLLQWKREKDGTTALMIEGAQRVGKSYIAAIEVKSSTGYTLTSIQKCIKKFGLYLSTPYVLHTKDVEQKDGLVYLPLYMTLLL